MCGLKTFVVMLAIINGIAVSVLAGIPYESVPSWVSEDTFVSTGCGFGDINGDGLHDLVVSNGNDIFAEPEEVYLNNGDGFDSLPAWLSTDEDYSGHLSIGDVNNDGFLDVAVGNYMQEGTGFPLTYSKVYYNFGGSLEALPSFYTSELTNTFSVAFGDVDLDGDLDLALANGEAYSSRPQANTIYYNMDGAFLGAPGWRSDDIDSSYDLAWGDVDNDGDLDLAVANCLSPTKVYYNAHGILETTAGWVSDSTYCDNSLQWGDVNGDSFLDLAVSTNSQLGSEGLYRVFFNTGGALETHPSWEAPVGSGGMGSGIALSDVDADGDLDLIGGSWWGATEIFENADNELSDAPVWVSNASYNSVIEAFAIGAVSAGSMRAVPDEQLSGDGNRQLFYLQHAPVIEITRIQIGDTLLTPEDYCTSLESGWIVFKSAPAEGVSNIHIDYSFVWRPDLAISNWDSAIGNYVYLNNLPTPSPTPIPTTTPTVSVQFDLQLNQSAFTGGDEFLLYSEITLFDTVSVPADLYVALEVNGTYFFYPGWTYQIDALQIRLFPNHINNYTILHAMLPEILESGGPYRFWGLITQRGNYSMLGNYDMVEFSFQ